MRRRLFNYVVRTLQVVSFLSVYTIGAGCNETAPDVIPISDPTRRIEFEGFSILPPRAEGWDRLNSKELNQRKVIENAPVRALITIRAYFIKWLSGKPPSSSRLHRLTAVVRTVKVDDLKVDDSVSLLQGMANEFSGETFLDKCFEQDCFRYQSTIEHQNPKCGSLKNSSSADL